MASRFFAKGSTQLRRTPRALLGAWRCHRHFAFHATRDAHPRARAIGAEIRASGLGLPGAVGATDAKHRSLAVLCTRHAERAARLGVERAVTQRRRPTVG